MTPAEYVAEHLITKELLRLGLTQAQLDALSFRSNNRDFPFELWTFRAAPGTPLEGVPLYKLYCTLKWLIFENPSPSRDRDDAYRYIADYFAAGEIGLANRYRARQSKRARKLRVKLAEGEPLKDVVNALVRRSPQQSRAKDLWPPFFATLEDLGVQPKEIRGLKEPAYTYDGPGQKRRRIAYSTFRKIVAAVRKSKVGK